MKKCVKIAGDRLAASIIFVIAGLEILSFILVETSTPGYYAVKLSPLIDNMQLFTASLLFIWKAFRPGACVFNKITTLMLSMTFLISIIYSGLRIIIDIKSPLLINFCIAILSISIVLMLIAYLLRICLKKFGITSSRY